MEIFIKIAFLSGTVLLGIYLFYLSAMFKPKKVDNGRFSIGSILFLLFGTLIWSILGTTIGRIASEFGGESIFRWFVYFILYFVFLRLPFGTVNRMIQKSYGHDLMPGKIVFSICMITFFILAICCFDKIPIFLKWHFILWK